MMRKTVILLGFLCAVLTLSGCTGSFFPESGEITSFEIIRALGIDESETLPGGVEVTMIAERARPSPGEEGGGVTYEVLSQSGMTAFEAVSKLRASSDKKQVFGYVDYILFGEKTAREDFTRFTDFPARNPEIRFSPKVFIVRGGTAKDLLSSTSSADVYVGDSLDNLSGNADARSDFGLVKNIELMNMLGDKNSAVILPAIKASEPDSGGLINGELPKKRLTAAGYAAICGYKLTGFFEGENARGYNLLTGGVRTGAYSVPDDSGEYVGLDVLAGAVKIKPHWRGGTLTKLDCTVRVDANIAEQRSLADLTSRGALDKLARRLSEQIEAELTGAAELSQQLGEDCFELGKTIRLMHPYRWRGISGKWREVYKNLKIDCGAEVTVRRVYDLREPSGYLTSKALSESE